MRSTELFVTSIGKLSEPPSNDEIKLWGESLRQYGMNSSNPAGTHILHAKGKVDLRVASGLRQFFRLSSSDGKILQTNAFEALPHLALPNDQVIRGLFDTVQKTLQEVKPNPVNRKSNEQLLLVGSTALLDMVMGATQGVPVEETFAGAWTGTLFTVHPTLNPL